MAPGTCPPSTPDVAHGCAVPPCTCGARFLEPAGGGSGDRAPDVEKETLRYKRKAARHSRAPRPESRLPRLLPPLGLLLCCVAANAQTITPLFSGAPATFALPAVGQPAIFVEDGEPVFVIDVPAGALSLNVDLIANAASANTDLDLFVRFGAVPTVENGLIVADYAGDSFLANESIAVSGASNPPLRAGRYFIALGQNTPGVAVGGTITATVGLPGLDQARIITTVAGTDFLFNDDGKPAVGAPLSLFLLDVEFSPKGELHFIDAQNAMVMKVREDGIVEVVAGNGSTLTAGIPGDAKTAGMRFPQSFAFSPDGDLYTITGPGNIFRVRDGQISFFASAGFEAPQTFPAMAFGPSGDLYIAIPLRHEVLRVSPAGDVTSFAGLEGIFGFRGDGRPANRALLSAPSDVAVDAAGNVYIADSNNFRVRRVRPDGIIETVAGTGVQAVAPLRDGPALETPLDLPAAINITPAGDLLILETPSFGGSFPGVVRRLTQDGRLETIAQTRNEIRIAADSAGSIYLIGSGRVRRIDPAGASEIVAGGGAYRFSGDGGPATSAHMNVPSALDVDAAGNLFIVDGANHRVRRVTTDGIMSTLVGDGDQANAGDGGPAREASLAFPTDLAFDPQGNLLIASTDTIRQVDPSGIISTFIAAGAAGLAPSFSVNRIATDPFGTVAVTDDTSHQVGAIDQAKNVFAIAGRFLGDFEGLGGEGGFSGDGGPALSATLNAPAGVAVAPDGSIVFADAGNNRIRRVALDGTIDTFVGGGDEPASTLTQNVPRRQVSLGNPSGVTFDPTGSLYFTEADASVVRVLSPNGLVSRVAGAIPRVVSEDGSLVRSGDGGPAIFATLVNPTDVAIGPDGSIFIADLAAHRVRKVLATPPAFFPLEPSMLMLAGSSNGPPSGRNEILIRAEVPGMEFSTEVRTADGGGWLEVDAATGATPRLLQVRANPGGLAPGRYMAQVDVTILFATPNQQRLNVAFDVGEELPPDPRLGATSLSFTYASGSEARSEPVLLSNRGGGSVGFNVSTLTDDGANWLSASPSAGTLTPADPITLAIAANPSGLPPGAYTGRVRVEAGQTLELPVTMTVSAIDQAMLIAQRGLSYLSVARGGVVPPQSFGVLNVGRGAMPFTTSVRTLSGGDWLRASPGAGAANPAQPAPLVQVEVNQSSLDAGEYYGLVEVTAPDAANSPQQIPVFLEVRAEGSNPGAQVTPSELVFTSSQGASPGSQNVFVYGISAGAKSFRAAPNTDLGSIVWFVTLPNDASLDPSEPTRILVQPRSAPLDPGIHSGRLPLQFSDGRVSTVDITLVQKAAGSGALSTEPGAVSQAACTPTALVPRASSLGAGFGVSAGWPVGMQVRVVDDCGEPLDSGAVTVDFSNGDPEISLVSLKNGRWDGTWQTSDSQLDQVTLRIRADEPVMGLSGEFELTGRLDTRLERPNFTREGIVSAADFDVAAPAPPSPGALVSIFGVRLSQGTAGITELPLPQELAGTSVFIGGIPAPLLFSSTGQVNALIPNELRPNTSHRVIIQRGTTLTEAVDISVAAAQPAVFRTSPAGRQGHIYRAVNGAQILAEPATAAQAGEAVIIYSAGLGAVDPPLVSGTAASANPLHRSVDPARVTIEGVDAPVFFSGLSPGFVGLYQVNAFVPEGLGRNDAASLVMEVGGARSPAVTIAVR